MVHEPKTRWAEAVPCSPSMFLAKKIVQYDNDNDNDKKNTKTNTVPCLPSMFLAKNIVQDNNDKYTDKDKYSPVFAFHVFGKENCTI